MYERLLLESGRLFRGKPSGIGANVVDDTRTITIPVLIPEGEAKIAAVNFPDQFIPGVRFDIIVAITNVGTYPDTLFIRLTNTDTGDVLGYDTLTLIPGGTLPSTFRITLVQEDDFNCLIEAGHVE